MLRRHFVRNVAASGLALHLAQPLKSFAMANAKNGIGLQLYTLRNQLEKDVEPTLQAVVEAGYKQVELMNVMDSVDIWKTAKDLGLQVRSAFFDWQSIANPGEQTPSIDSIIEQAEKFGLEYMVFGYIGTAERDSADKIRKIADRANEVAEKIREAGMKMSYHNHSFEFESLEGDTTGFEIFEERFDKDLVNFELDVFWAAIGGCDPVETLERLGSRVGQVHLKDLKAGSGVIYDEGKVPHDAFQEVGDGSLDMKAVMKVALANGVQQFHVEQDQSPDPIESVGQVARYVAKNLW